MSSYDLYAPRWATTSGCEFKARMSFRTWAGEFVWTGFDYLGEPTPYDSDLSNLINYTDPAEKARAGKGTAGIGKIRSPSRSSYFGIVDLAGFKKDRFYFIRRTGGRTFPWRTSCRTELARPRRPGHAVHVYTSGDSAELFLNGKSLGLKKKDNTNIAWNGTTWSINRANSRWSPIKRQEMGDGRREKPPARRPN